MIRFLFRFLGLLCLALAFIFLVYDGTKSIADHQLLFTRVDYVWAMIGESGLAQVKPALDHIGLWLWPIVDTYFLRAPCAAVLVILGALLMLIGRKKKPLIGYARD
jgi:hypothetical protein